MKKINTCLLLLLLLSGVAQGQISDLARVEYTVLPRNNSTLAYNRIRTLFNYPIRLKKEGAYWVAGIDFSYINTANKKNTLPFDIEKLSSFSIFNINNGYTAKLKNNWRYGIRLQTGFSSNLSEDKLKFEDIAFSGDLVFIKNNKDNPKVKKPNRLIIGISLSQNRGFPILPFILYYRKFHKKWSYLLGVPKTNIQYHINTKNRLKLIARLDGFSANLQQEITIPNQQGSATRFRNRLIIGGIRYEHKFTKHLEYYINGSYILDNAYELRDEDLNTFFDFTNLSKFYLKSGIRFKL